MGLSHRGRALGLALGLAAAACSSSKRRAPDDALTVPRGDAAVAHAKGSGATGVLDPVPPDDAAPLPVPPTTGDLQVRAEWKDVPAALRAAPGRTPCHTPRTPAVSPTTTWGIPEALIIVEGAPSTLEPARVVVGDCTVTPRVVAASSLIVESAVDHPVEVVLVKRGELARIEKLAAGTPRRIQLPIAGHAVAVPLDAGGIYELRTDAKPPETAWIVAAPAAVTEPSGQIVVRDLPPGSYAVRAWLPPRAGAPARTATGKIDVEVGELADLTLDLAAR